MFYKIYGYRNGALFKQENLRKISLKFPWFKYVCPFSGHQALKG